MNTQFHLHDGKMTIERTQDCQAIAEHCKTAHVEGRHGTSEMKHAASIPFVFVEKYCNDKGISFHECMSNKVHIRAMLTDPALQHFRIWKGRI